MVPNQELLEEEASLIRASVKALSAEPERAKGAVTHAAEEIVRLSLPNGQKNLTRRLMARLIAYRLARLDGNEALTSKHYKQFDILRGKLIRKGVSEDDLRQAAIGVTKQIVSE